MDDIPQGGAGGVPLHHDDEDEKHEAKEDRPGRATAPSVRAGEPVAEQKAETEGDED